VPVNLKLEAMRGLYDGKKTMFVRADYGKEIIEAVQFAQLHGVKKVVVVGATDAWMVTDFLKENNVPVILNALHRLPSREEEDVDMPYKLPALLHKAGVLVGLAYGEGPMQLRNLPFVAGNAVGYGLTKEEALMLVTANNAKILGIDDKTGTLAVGKDANLVVSSGDLLDMRTNDVTHAFVGGRPISLDNKHKRLYGRFNAKYGF
jgi:imidazolonepropionase-like amidohydrolase